MNQVRFNGARLARTVVLLVGMVSVVVLAPAAVGATDQSTPYFSNLSLTRYNVKPGHATKVRVRIADQFGVMDSPFIEYRKSDGVLGPSAFFHLIRGSHTDGVWEATVTFDQYTPEGLATVSRLYAYDTQGNQTIHPEGDDFANTANVTIVG